MHITLSILLLFSFFVPVQAETGKANPVPQISAESYILIDATSGRSLLEKNADKKQYPASTTKIMTAALAIEMGYYNKTTTVSQFAVDNIGVNGSNVGLKAGEELSFRDLLNMALISSANDAANVIAEGVSGNIKAFVGVMNSKAAALGLTNTHFDNPVGLDAGDGYPTHQTTARDLAKIMRYATSFELFRDIAGKTNYTLPVTNIHTVSRGARKSTDLLLTDSRFENTAYAVVSGKTGYTQAAQNAFVASARNEDGIELILVLMKNTDRDEMFANAADLFDYGFNLAQGGSPLTQRGLYDIRMRGTEPVIDQFYQAGFITGDIEGKFGYADMVSREEFFSVLNNIRNGIFTPGGDKSFLEQAIEEGLADGEWAGTEKRIMTRSDAISVISRFVRTEPDSAEILVMMEMITDFDAIPDALKHDALRVYKAGIINGRGDGSIGAGLNLTKEEMVLILNNYLKYLATKSDLVRII